MRRINVTLNNVRITESFQTKGKLIRFLRGNEMFLFSEISNNVFDIADKIWNLNVGKSITYFNHQFSIQSKQRVGNQLYDGSTIN